MSTTYNEMIVRQYAFRTEYGYIKDNIFIIHRDNGLPAVECANGSEYWYVNGKRIQPPTEVSTEVPNLQMNSLKNYSSEQLLAELARRLQY